MRSATLAALLLVGCGGATTVEQGAGGAGAASSSASPAPADAGCSTCRAVLLGDNPIATAKALCDGSAASAALGSLLTCACADGGPCFPACSWTAWCTGLTPTPKTWADPAGECAICIGDYAAGCGDEQGECWSK